MKVKKSIIGGAVLLQCLLADNYIVNPSYVELEPQNDPTVRMGDETEREIAQFPAYMWTYGCTPTAYGMIAVYWANNYRDVYPELANVLPEILKTPTDMIPLVNKQWKKDVDDGWKLGDLCLTYPSNTSECQFIASRASSQLFYNKTELVEFASDRPHVALCWSGATQKASEITAFCAEYRIPEEDLGKDDFKDPDCIAAYCKTSIGDDVKSNGATNGFSLSNGKKSKKNDAGVKGFIGYLNRGLGIGRFEIDGYSQYVNSDIGSKMAIYGEPYPEIDEELEKDYRDHIVKNGFSWFAARELIDKNIPFVLNLKAVIDDTKHSYHSVTCYGYKVDAGGTRYLRCKTTWSTEDADIPWEGLAYLNGNNYAIYSVDVFTLDDIEKKTVTRGDADSVQVITLGQKQFLKKPENLTENDKVYLRLFTTSGFEDIVSVDITNGQIIIPPFDLLESTEWIVNHRNRISGEVYSLDETGNFSYREAIEVTFNKNSSTPSANVEVNRVLPNMGFKLTASNDGGALQYNGIVWDFGDGKKGRGYSVSHSYDEPGTYTVTVSMLGQNGETSISTLNLDVKEDITPIAVPNDIANRNSAIIKGSEALLSLQSATSVTINLFSLRGQQVASIKKGELSSGFYRVNLATQTNLASGSYVVQVNIGSKVLNSKVVIQ